MCLLSRVMAEICKHDYNELKVLWAYDKNSRIFRLSTAPEFRPSAFAYLSGAVKFTLFFLFSSKKTIVAKNYTTFLI